MKRYFDLQMLYDDDAFSIRGSELSFNRPDRFCINNWTSDLGSYLSNFTFSINQNGPKQGFLANNLGWIIINNCFLQIINDNSSTLLKEIISWTLPESLTCLDHELINYRIIAFRREIECLDYQNSDLVWETKDDGSKYIASIRKLVLKTEKIQGYNMFRIAEFPFIPVISEQVYELLTLLKLTGWGAAEISQI